MPTNSDENRKLLQHDLSRLHERLEHMNGHLSDLKSITAVQNEQLAAHMRRSDLLEKRVEQVDARVNPLEKLAYSIRTIISAIVFLLTLPHIERLVRWLLAYFSSSHPS